MLSPLFSEAVQGVLAAVTLQPDRQWYLSDLAAHLGVRPSTLQRALRELVGSGFLVRTRSGNRVYYRADPDCPILPEIRGIMSKTLGIAPLLREALSPLREDISVAFIHGSVAENREESGSDVDLIVVGKVRPSRLAMALRQGREALAREVNPTVYSLKEFAEKLAKGHHFLAAVMKKPKVFLIGNENELGGLRPAGRHRGRGSTEAE